MQRQLTRNESIKTIYQAGGRMVLLQDFPASDRRAKEPLPGLPWATYRPTLDEVMENPGLLGVIPASLHSTAIDIDRGDPHRFPMGYCDYPSRRAGGFHKWFHETQQFRDCHWEGKGFEGDIRSKGYLIPWGVGLHRLARALLAGRQLSLFPFPEEFFRELVQGREVEVHRPARGNGLPTVPRSLWTQGMPLEAVQVGARYVALFWHMRKWAYPQTRGLYLGDWKARVLDECYSMNERFPVPFRGNEVRKVKDTALSVACWTWNTLLDYGRYRTPALQAGRGRASGASRREGSIEQLRPWEAEGICRATWYNRKRRS